MLAADSLERGSRFWHITVAAYKCEEKKQSFEYHRKELLRHYSICLRCCDIFVVIHNHHNDLPLDVEPPWEEPKSIEALRCRVHSFHRAAVCVWESVSVYHLRFELISGRLAVNMGKEDLYYPKRLFKYFMIASWLERNWPHLDAWGLMGLIRIQIDPQPYDRWMCFSCFIM